MTRLFHGVIGRSAGLPLGLAMLSGISCPDEDLGTAGDGTITTRFRPQPVANP
jgi:hypothetical protein